MHEDRKGLKLLQKVICLLKIGLVSFKFNAQVVYIDSAYSNFIQIGAVGGQITVEASKQIQYLETNLRRAYRQQLTVLKIQKPNCIFLNYITGISFTYSHQTQFNLKTRKSSFKSSIQCLVLDKNKCMGKIKPMHLIAISQYCSEESSHRLCCTWCRPDTLL